MSWCSIWLLICGLKLAIFTQKTHWLTTSEIDVKHRWHRSHLTLLLRIECRQLLSKIITFFAWPSHVITIVKQRVISLKVYQIEVTPIVLQLVMSLLLLIVLQITIRLFILLLHGIDHRLPFVHSTHFFRLLFLKDIAYTDFVVLHRTGFLLELLLFFLSSFFWGNSRW